MVKSFTIEEFLENAALAGWGRSRKDPICVTCGSDAINPEDFKDDLSRKEFTLSRMCQACQIEVFGVDD